jgi:hypothetical protein
MVENLAMKRDNIVLTKVEIPLAAHADRKFDANTSNALETPSMRCVQVSDDGCKWCENDGFFNAVSRVDGRRGPNVKIREGFLPFFV